jgi:hypothetical protein
LNWPAARAVIETLPTLQHDPNWPEDVRKVDEDEAGVTGLTTPAMKRWAMVDHGKSVVRSAALRTAPFTAHQRPQVGTPKPPPACRPFAA